MIFLIKLARKLCPFLVKTLSRFIADAMAQKNGGRVGASENGDGLQKDVMLWK